MEPQRSSQVPSTQPATESTNSVRTYVSDIAQLIAQNKLTQKEVAKLDPKILEAVKLYQVQGPKIPKPQNTSGIEMVHPDTFVKKIEVPTNTKPEQTQPVFDTDATKSIPQAQVRESISAASDQKVSTEKVSENTLVHARAPVGTTLADGAVIAVPKKEEPSKTESEVSSETIDKKDIAKSEPIKTEVPKAPVQKTPVHPPVHPPIATVTETKPVKPLKEIPIEQKLDAEARELTQKLDAIKREEQQIETKKQTLIREKESIEAKGAPLKLKENEIERSERDIEDLEKAASSVDERRALRQKRWNMEDERQRVERERWDIDQKILDISKQVEVLETQKTQVISKEQSLAEMLKKVERQKVAFKAIADKTIMVQKLTEINALRVKLETDWKEHMKKKEALQAKLDDVVSQENSVRQEIEGIETKEREAKDGTEEHAYELKRWQKDVELRKLEESEDDVAFEEGKLEDEIAAIEAQSQEILSQEKDLKDKIAALEQLIRGGR